MRIPTDVLYILKTLSDAGFEAYAVGGCVRDAVLGREPEDWDITTNAVPAEVKGLFRRTLDTGIEHGTVTVMRGKTGYEVTTYRVDGKYSDGRHPDSVTFTPELSEDLKRRDFTINAMACGQDGEIVDLFGGQADLERRLIRCVGEPDERFTEDALRILRAVRFSAQLDFLIEEGTMAALRRHAPNLVHVSRERILAELNKTILSDHPEKLALLSETGILPFIGDDAGFGRLCVPRAAALLPKEKYVRWAAAFRFLPGQRVREILRGLKSDTETADRAALLADELKRPLPLTETETRIRLAETGPDRFDDLLSLARAGFGVPGGEDPEGCRAADGAEPAPAGADRAEGGDAAGSAEYAEGGNAAGNTEYAEGGNAAGSAEYAEKMKRDILARGDCIALKDLKMTGRDLIAMGVKSGPGMGKLLGELFRHVLEHPEDNTPEMLKEIAGRASGSPE